MLCCLLKLCWQSVRQVERAFAALLTTLRYLGCRAYGLTCPALFAHVFIQPGNHKNYTGLGPLVLPTKLGTLNTIIQNLEFGDCYLASDKCLIKIRNILNLTPFSKEYLIYNERIKENKWLIQLVKYGMLPFWP